MRFLSPRPPAGQVVDMLTMCRWRTATPWRPPYEYMLGKIAAAGQNGQFRTPRHIIPS